MTPEEARRDGRPLCFVSGGVGFTPFMGILEALLINGGLADPSAADPSAAAADSATAEPLRVDFLQCVHKRGDHAMAVQMNNLAKNAPSGAVDLRVHAFYSRESATPEVQNDLSNIKLNSGRITLEVTNLIYIKASPFCENIYFNINDIDYYLSCS